MVYRGIREVLTMNGGFKKPRSNYIENIDDSSLYGKTLISLVFSPKEIDYMISDIEESNKIFNRLRKECKACGCIMSADHESDLCECCEDDREEV